MKSKSDAAAADPLADGSLQVANRCLVGVRYRLTCGLPFMPDFLLPVPTIRRSGEVGLFTRSCGIFLVEHSNNSLNALNTAGSAMEQ